MIVWTIFMMMILGYACDRPNDREMTMLRDYMFELRGIVVEQYRLIDECGSCLSESRDELAEYKGLFGDCVDRMEGR